jgi:glycosyl transferase family 92
MSEGAWSRFLEYAAHARTKPAFELEERQPKLEVAAKLQRTLAAVRDDGDWQTCLLEALRSPSNHPFVSPRYLLMPPRCRRWVYDWIDGDSDSLADALTVFLDGGLDPATQFARFAEAGERRTEESAAGDPRAMELGRRTTFFLGSFLAFSGAPESVPVVRGFFGHLQELLGVDGPQKDSLAGEYAAQLDFAREVRVRMEAHPIPGIDMIDVQSLMLIAVQEQVLWAETAPEHVTVERPPAGAYLAACSLYLNEAQYLREWLEFHRLVGVERFFLYDNGSTDNHLDVLAPYVENGIVTIHEWQPSPPDQREVYEDCLRRHREDARWIAFLDIDEFLFSPGAGLTEGGVAKLLRDYERWPGVGVNWAMFSHSCHRTRPEGLVIDRYRLHDSADTGLMKSIVDPLRAVRCESAHSFTYDHGLPVDENHWPIAAAQTRSTSFERLRVNHYASRSEEELHEKVKRGSGWSHLKRWRMRDLRGELDLVRDDSIARWVPELEQALGRAGVVR